MSKHQQFPELWGQQRVAEELGIGFANNVYRVARLPEPKYGPDKEPPFHIDRGQLWLADDIRAFKVQREKEAR